MNPVTRIITVLIITGFSLPVYATEIQFSQYDDCKPSVNNYEPPNCSGPDTSSGTGRRTLRKCSPNINKCGSRRDA